MIRVGESILDKIEILLDIEEDKEDLLCAILSQFKNLDFIEFNSDSFGNYTKFWFKSRNNNTSLCLKILNHEKTSHRDYFLQNI